MLSPVKAITAGAIVFAIGSALLVAQPFDQQGTVPGAAETSPPPPVEFSGRWGHGPQVAESTVTTVDGGVAVTGAVFQPFVAHMSDPRLAGDVTVTPNSITYGPGRGPVLWHKAFRIENEDGAWQEQPSFTMYYPDGSGWDWTSVLVGEGGYEGLLAIANVHHDDSGWDLEGYIVEGGPPEAPQTTSR